MNTTITTAKGNELRSFILNDKDGKPVGFATPKTEKSKSSDKIYYGILVFDKDDEKITYTKCKDFIRAFRPSTSRQTGESFNWEMFIELEQFKLVKVSWKENASLAACIESEDTIDKLFKLVKANKSGAIWMQMKNLGLKNDTERKAKLSKWCKNPDFLKKALALYANDCPELDDAPAL